MTRSEIKTLCQDLCLDQADDNTLDQFYDDTIESLAKRSGFPVAGVEFVAASDGTAEYNFPTNAILELAIFFDDQQLSFCSPTDLMIYDSDWYTTSTTGTPFAYTKLTNPRTFIVYPASDTDSDAFIFSHGEPFGQDFPDNAFTVFFTSKRETDIPDTVALAIAFKTLSLEFSYPSDHMDVAFSNMCASVGELLYKMAGL